MRVHRGRTGVTVAACCAAFAFSPLARAEANADVKAAPQEQPTHWYGWQTLAADGGSVFLFLTSLALFDGGSEGTANALAWTSLGTYVLSGPIIHGFHGHAGKALGSLGLRVAAPLVGGLVGTAAWSGCKKEESDDLCTLEGAGLGVLLGMATAITIDGALLAYEPIPNEPADTGLRWLPAVGFSRDAAWIGVGGSL